jgi:DNA-binding transcriptional regulator YdaS (Cro superfamily)
MTKKILDRDPGVLVAINSAGGVVHLAYMLGVKSPSISGWVQVPANRVLEIEKLTEHSPFGQATRYQMRPDLYPREHLKKSDPDKKGFLPDLMKVKVKE